MTLRTSLQDHGQCKGRDDADQGRDSDLELAGRLREECSEGVGREVSPVHERGVCVLQGCPDANGTGSLR